MLEHKRTLGRDIFFLIADGFEESPVALCIETMRGHGLEVSLVGLSSRVNRGKNGLVMQTDITVADIKSTPNQSMVVVSGDTQCSTSLLSDPRVHRMIRGALCNDGVIAATRSAEKMTRTVAIPTKSHSKFIPQGARTINEFIDYLVIKANG